ncbi:MAG: fumarylacetoacetase [Pseudomonadota bacterium]
MSGLNETHDTNLNSWVGAANEPDSDFTIQNLPFAEFRRRDSGDVFRGGIAIGDQILDLAAVSQAGVFSGNAAAGAGACAQPTLNAFMAMGSEAWSALRLAVSRGLRIGSGVEDVLRQCLVPQTDAEYALPCTIGDYTDFFASIHHATTTGRLFRPENPLSSNYKWIPISYHGRSSSISVSGDPVRRPIGQSMTKNDAEPRVAPSKKLDYELELGIFIGRGNPLGTPIDIERATEHVFGVCLLNDWSARDIQAWESRPLGPFLGKSFSTTISPWIVTMDALKPFRAAYSRPADDPNPSAYLTSDTNSSSGAVDIQFEVSLQTNRMRESGQKTERLSAANFAACYWTIAQMVAHHTVNGCNLRTGDLFGSGTQSGPGSNEGGCLLELSSNGREPISLRNGESRCFLEDGDTVVLRGWCQRDGAARVGFGELRNTIVPAP